MMNANKLLNLSKSEQENWLIETHGTLHEIASDGEHYCFKVHCGDSEISEYLGSPEDHETGRLLQESELSISTERAELIESGSPVTEEEKNVLKKLVADILSEDAIEGVNYTFRPIKVFDEEIVVTFSSIIAGAGGPEYSFHDIHRTREDALNSVKTLSKDEFFFIL